MFYPIISRMQVADFLDDYGAYIFPTHRALIHDYLRLFDECVCRKDAPKLSEHGFHFQSCLWSNDNIWSNDFKSEDPENCNCQYFYSKMIQLEDLINKYYMLETRLYLPLP